MMFRNPISGWVSDWFLFEVTDFDRMLSDLRCHRLMCVFYMGPSIYIRHLAF